MHQWVIFIVVILTCGNSSALPHRVGNLDNQVMRVHCLLICLQMFLLGDFSIFVLLI